MTRHSHPSVPTQFAGTANFAARDDNVRCLSYGVMRKLGGLPQDLFADYWRDGLGPLLARLPSVGYYVQHHFSPDHRAHLWPLPDGIRRMDVVLDGAAEVGFVITMAGLRGGRTAQLIERVGAVNRTQDAVTRRFVQDPYR
jgi:hypothetical protein